MNEQELKETQEKLFKIYKELPNEYRKKLEDDFMNLEHKIDEIYDEENS